MGQALDNYFEEPSSPAIRRMTCMRVARFLGTATSVEIDTFPLRCECELYIVIQLPS